MYKFLHELHVEYVTAVTEIKFNLFLSKFLIIYYSVPIFNLVQICLVKATPPFSTLCRSNHDM